MNDRADIERELNKIDDALAWAITREEKNSEANAAQHCSEKVLYSPLTIKLQLAKDALAKLSGVLLDN